MPQVSSSHLASVDFEKGTMTVAFRDGSVYAYQGVGAATYTALLDAKSKGKFFRSAVQGKFKYAVIKKPKATPKSPPEKAGSTPGE